MTAESFRQRLAKRHWAEPLMGAPAHIQTCGGCQQHWPCDAAELLKLLAEKDAQLVDVKVEWAELQQLIAEQEADLADACARIEAVTDLHHEVQRAFSAGQIAGPDGPRAVPVTYVRSCSCGNDYCPTLAALTSDTEPKGDAVPKCQCGLTITRAERTVWLDHEGRSMAENGHYHRPVSR